MKSTSGFTFESTKSVVFGVKNQYIAITLKRFQRIKCKFFPVISTALFCFTPLNKFNRIFDKL